MLAASCLSGSSCDLWSPKGLGLAPWLPMGVHSPPPPRQALALRAKVWVPLPSLSCLRFTPRNTNSLIYVFNVANGQLNELQFVIFMVNLKSCSCWLILLLGSKTGRHWCCCSRDPNRHLMLHYGHGQNKGAPGRTAGRGAQSEPPRVPARCPSHPPLSVLTSKLRSPVWHQLMV